MKRKGLGKGLGMGYKNIVPKDPFIHGLSAKGVSSVANPIINKRIVDARQLTKKEVADEGWMQSTTALVLEDGTLVYPSQDDEGNNAGALFGKMADGETVRFGIQSRIDAKGKSKIPKIKDIMTEDEVKKRYQYELDEGLINTEEEGVPYYDDFNEFKRMMQDMNIKILDDGTSGQDRESYTDTQDRESYTVDAKGKPKFLKLHYVFEGEHTPSIELEFKNQKQLEQDMKSAMKEARISNFDYVYWEGVYEGNKKVKTRKELLDLAVKL